MLFAPFGPGCWLGVAKLLPEIVHWRRFLIKARIILSVRCFGLVFGSFVSFRHLLVSHSELILTQCLLNLFTNTLVASSLALSTYLLDWLCSTQLRLLLLERSLKSYPLFEHIYPHQSHKVNTIIYPSGLSLKLSKSQSPQFLFRVILNALTQSGNNVVSNAHSLPGVRQNRQTTPTIPFGLHY